MTKIQIIELAIGAVIFAACLVGFIHFKGLLASDAENKKLKRKKKTFFFGMIAGAWVVLGVVFTVLSGMKPHLAIDFSMFSERIELPGLSFSPEETTVTAAAITVILIILCVLFRIFVFPKFKDKPEGIQNVVEILVEAMNKFTAGAVHNEKFARELSSYMFAVAMFISGCAASELFGLRAPTSDLTCTFALSLITFMLINIYGIKSHGLGGRLASMGGSIKAMRPIMIPLKMVSDIATPVSLACRLFGNMLGGLIVMDLLKGALGGYASGIPALAGIYFNLFHPLIQAYIFIILSLTFIDEAVE